jgi:respiratory burst oxidase
MRGGGGGGPGVATPGRPRWGSGVTTPRSLSTGSSPRGSDRSSDDGEELVEVTLDLLEDDNIVLRSVEPAAAAAAAGLGVGASPSSSGAPPPPRRHPEPPSGAPSRSRSPAMRRTSSHRLLQFSQELKATASRAKQFSQDLTKRFTRTQSRANLVGETGAAAAAAPSGIDAALEARAQRRRRAQLDRTKSGAHRAIRGLRFISGGNKTSNAWIEVQANFDRLARDGYLSRDDFPKCIGSFQSLSAHPFPEPPRASQMISSS